MKIGFLFAGQGAQYVGMGKDFYEHYDVARKIYDGIEMDFSVKDVCFNGPKDVLNDTAYTQSCILATSLVMASVLKAKGIVPDYAAGLSLGEYSALTYANALSLNDALEIVRKRGLIMANALPAGTTKMAAVLMCDEKTIADACQKVSRGKEICTIANYNCPGQIVITGTNQAVDEACELLKGKARRCIPLQVSGAFHSPLLSEAADELKRVLDTYSFTEPAIPVVYNISGKEEEGAIPSILQQQIKSSVYFTQTIEYMIDRGVDTFIEIGPGHSLSGFVKKTSRDVCVYNIDSVEDVEKITEVLIHGK